MLYSTVIKCDSCGGTIDRLRYKLDDRLHDTCICCGENSWIDPSLAIMLETDIDTEEFIIKLYENV